MLPKNVLVDLILTTPRKKKIIWILKVALKMALKVVLKMMKKILVNSLLMKTTGVMMMNLKKKKKKKKNLALPGEKGMDLLVLGKILNIKKDLQKNGIGNLLTNVFLKYGMLLL